MVKRGQFITFDGIDGAGKSTQIACLADYLLEHGCVVHVTREPGGTGMAEKIRDLLLNKSNDMGALTELLLMFASRAEHIDRVLRPKIEAGEWVICSRFTDATIAYQGYGRRVSLESIHALADVVHRDFNPDMSFFLDLPAELAADRRLMRGEADDRFESEVLGFMQVVRNGYLTIAEAEPLRCKVIDATQSIEHMKNHIIAHIQTLTK